MSKERDRLKNNWKFPREKDNFLYSIGKHCYFLASRLPLPDRRGGRGRECCLVSMIGERCAERPGSGMLLWQHEFYFVPERDGSGPPKPYIYEAVEFRKGSDLPEVEKENMSRKQLLETWVLGVAYAPASEIRKWSKREKGYLFHTEVNDTDARTVLFWKCPEVVRIENCTVWRAMSTVLTAIPRVVHPNDVYSGDVHVAGRALHYVCGMCCDKIIAKSTKKGQQEEGSFDFLKRLIREEPDEPFENGFCMYPEERLGSNINSAGIMWEMIEEVFEGIRKVMSESGRARSGSINLMWSRSLLQFWEVSVFVISLALTVIVYYNPH